jgi:hypothetical protein
MRAARYCTGGSLSLSRHGGTATGVESRIFDECPSVSEYGRVGDHSPDARPAWFARRRGSYHCGRADRFCRLLADAARSCRCRHCQEAATLARSH